MILSVFHQVRETGSLIAQSCFQMSEGADDQLKVEIEWCLARLEEKLSGLDPFSRTGTVIHVNSSNAQE